MAKHVNIQFFFIFCARTVFIYLQTAFSFSLCTRKAQWPKSDPIPNATWAAQVNLIVCAFGPPLEFMEFMEFVGLFWEHIHLPKCSVNYTNKFALFSAQRFFIIFLFS